MTKRLAIIILLFVLAGCGNAFEDNVKKGDKALSDSNKTLDEVIEFYEIALKKQPNDETLQEKIKLVNHFSETIHLISASDWAAAKEAITPIIDYHPFPEWESFYESIADASEVIDYQLATIEKAETMIATIEEHLKNEAIEEAKSELDMFDLRIYGEEYEEQINDFEQQIVSLEEKIEDYIFDDTEYSAYAIKDKNKKDPKGFQEGVVYRAQIKNDSLIIWGSMTVSDLNDAENQIFLPDGKRIFPLADDVFLPVLSQGSKAEQIEEFNEGGIDYSGFYLGFYIEDGKVKSIGYAG